MQNVKENSLSRQNTGHDIFICMWTVPQTAPIHTKETVLMYKTVTCSNRCMSHGISVAIYLFNNYKIANGSVRHFVKMFSIGFSRTHNHGFSYNDINYNEYAYKHWTFIKFSVYELSFLILPLHNEFIFLKLCKMGEPSILGLF